MKKLFIGLYNYLHSRKIALWFLLVATTAALAAMASQLKIDENISSFFPKGNDTETDFVMRHMKAVDQIVVIVSDRDTTADDVYKLMEVAEMYRDSLRRHLPENVSVTLGDDNDLADSTFQMILQQLPMLLTDDDFDRLATLTTDSAIAQRMATNRDLLMSMFSIGVSNVLPFDPLGMATPVLMRLKEMSGNSGMTVIDGYVMDRAQKHLIMFINLPEGFEDTGNNAQLVADIRHTAHQVADAQQANIHVYGAPVVAVANSNRVKADECITLSIAIAITVTVILLVFRRKRTIFLIMLPVVFGSLFAFATIAATGTELSLMAVGTGAIVLGVAMSYSIHMVTHSQHAANIRELIADMAYPMTIGSVTTIGAFVGLMFTDSKILHDLGLFASAALVGTLIFCLVFLPHFLVTEGKDRQRKALKFIEKIAGYDYSKNKILVGALAVVTVVCLFFFNDVSFDNDMTKLNYQGDKELEESREVMENVLSVDGHRTSVVVTADDIDRLAQNGLALSRKADSLGQKGLSNFTSIAPNFLVPKEEQQRRIDRWNAFWTPERRQHVMATIDAEAARCGFNAGSFDPFKRIIEKEYSPVLPNSNELMQNGFYSNWITRKDSTLMMYANLELETESRDEVMQILDNLPNVVVTDMGYFVRKSTSSIVDNFNTTLLICSILVGLVLLVSYGRFELFVMTFLPMCIGWVIILGLMALFGIEFNFVNIILSTFIFGVGDDFSIFIMDGLLSEYKSGKKILASHKTAIALSAFAIVIGLGVQVFAQHPAIRSIGLLSVFGMVAVILTSYVVQPIMFRWFISKPASVGFPFTLWSAVRSLIIYSTFLIGCVLINIALLSVVLLPLPHRWKETIVHYAMFGFMRGFYGLIGLFFRIRTIGKLDTSRPSIIIGNHQSFVDIIAVLAMSPKIVFVTKTWVTSSPLFGMLVKYCGFYNSDNGSDGMIDAMRRYAAAGYSIAIFPEGTRSTDNQIHRFHKGAFKLADELKLDITPLLMFGNGMVASKIQPFLLKSGIIVNKFLPRISHDDATYGANYVERSKAIARYMRDEYENLKVEYDSVHNPFYYKAIIRNVTYHSPHVEWYLRIKIRMEHCYGFFDKHVPKSAMVTDIGCGYGPLCFMLAMRCRERKIVGIDYDDEKIDAAAHSFLARHLGGERLKFVAADAVNYDLPVSDVFILNDMLHYLQPDGQQALLRNCLARLNRGGIIMLRDGDSSSKKNHKVTKMTEVFSTKIFKFNKTANELHFVSATDIEQFAYDNNLSVNKIRNDKYTSNTIFILKKQEADV